MMDYAELQVRTNFSFLRGASHADELIAAAKDKGLAAIAVTDANTLAGIVRAHVAAKEHDVRLIVGCRLDLEDAPSLLCYPTDRAAYARLCRLLTTGQRRAEKGACRLSLDDVAAHGEGQRFIIVPPAPLKALADEAFGAALARLRRSLGAPYYLAASCLYRGDDRRRLARLAALARQYGTPLVATNDVHYHVPERKALHDVLTCIREGCTIGQAGHRLHANAERHIKDAGEMARLFAGYEEAVERTLEIAEGCRFSLDALRYEYPDEPVPPGKTPQQHLVELTWDGARRRYPDGVPEAVAKTLKRELALIEQLDYAPYFLTVHDIVRWARRQGILCQGRGSAANSAVCYCLFITAVDPARVDLLFERFMSAERKEPPDIDVDFEHERREEVIQYIYRRYGRERAGLAATVIHYRWRSAVRDVGKAMGLSQDVVGALASTIWGRWGDGLSPRQVRDAGLDPQDPHLRRCIRLAQELVGFPRHLSQHVGGFVLTRGPLCELVPIGNAAMAGRTVIEWDKDDLDALGILKVDVLGLGMLTCLRKGFELLATHYRKDYTLATVPQEDARVYDMLCRADSIGVFQVESRAQMNMLPRLKPRCFYDLVIEVAIVRPGPIQGDMVHPYLRRRSGIEAETYPSPDPACGPADELRQVLGKTLGVPLFQEQAMKIAMVAAGFTADEANQLRRAMATFRRLGTIGRFRDKMVEGMVRRGYDRDFAERCFRQIEGFGEYGFPESHAASFALLVYVSAWLKCHYPAVFACALLNAQPMGFYAAAQIVRDARDHGVEVRAVDVNHSDWDNSLEPAGTDTFALRLGLRQVKGMARGDAEMIVRARAAGYRDIAEVWRRAGVPVPALERLAAADGFTSMGLDRRQALWAVRALASAARVPDLFTRAGVGEGEAEPKVSLPAMAPSAQVIDDYRTLHLSLKAHPMAFLREALAGQGIISARQLTDMEDGAAVDIAGIVLVRQRPGSAKGVVFMTLEDETGVANAVIWPWVLERDRAILMASRLIRIRGRVQRADDIIHVVAGRLIDCTGLLSRLAQGETDKLPSDNPTAPVRPEANPLGHPRNVRLIPKSRDFR